ncbi:MmyB family transcriptional regulator [Streptomyces sp. NPDC055722]
MYRPSVRAARDLYVNWAETARNVVGKLCLYASYHPMTRVWPSWSAICRSGEWDFRRWWAGHDVHWQEHGVKRYHHPLVGELTLGYVAFNPVGDPSQMLGLHTAESGSPSENALRMLASWTASKGHLDPGEPAEQEH